MAVSKTCPVQELSMPERPALQQRVLSVALVRLSESLAAPSDRARSICRQLGVQHEELAAAVRDQQLSLERRSEDSYCYRDELLSQVGSGLDGDADTSCSEMVESVTSTNTKQTLSLPSNDVMAIVQDLSSTFFAQEVLHGERALGDARARLAALWDKLVEMSAERDKTLNRLNVPPDQRDLFTVLGRVLDQAPHEEEDKEEQDSPRALAEDCLGPCDERGLSLRSPDDRPLRGVSTPFDYHRRPCRWGSPVPKLSPEFDAGGGSPSTTSPTTPSCLHRPRADRRRRSLPSTGISSNAPRDGDTVAKSSSLPHPQSRHLFPSTPPAPMVLRERSGCERCRGSGDSGDVGGSGGSPHADGAERGSTRRLTLGRAGEEELFTVRGVSGDGEMGTVIAVTADRQRTGVNRSQGESARSGWNTDDDSPDSLHKEVDGLRGQRDALACTLSFARQQYAEALGDKPVQIERLTREVELLRRASDALRVELEEARREKVEEVERLEQEATTLREEAANAERRAEVEARGRASAEARLGDHIGTTEVLEQKALALKAKSKSMVAKNELLQGRLDASLREIEELLSANKALQTEVIDGHRSAEAARARETALRSDAEAKTGQLRADLHVAKAQLARLEENTESLLEAERAAVVEADSHRMSLAEACREAAATAAVTDAATIAAAEREAKAIRDAELVATTAQVETKATIKALAARDTELMALKEDAARSIQEDRSRWEELLEASREKASKAEQQLEVSCEKEATATREREAWAVRSGEWEAEAERLTDALKVAVKDTAGVREEYEVAVALARRQLVEAKEGFIKLEQLRAEEATAALDREAGLKAALRLAQEAVQTSTANAETQVSTTASVETIVATAATASTDDFAALRDELRDAQARLYEVKEERDTAVTALLDCTRAGPTSQHCKEESGSASDYGVGDDHRYSDWGDSSDGNTKYGSSSSSSSEVESAADIELKTKADDAHECKILSGRDHPASCAYRSPSVGVGASRARETGGRVASPATPVLCSVQTSENYPARSDSDTSMHSSVAGSIIGAGGVDAGGERVCSLCNARASASHKLFDTRQEQSRARVAVAEPRVRVLEAGENAAAASENARASRCDYALEAALEKNIDKAESADMALSHSSSESRASELLAIREELGTTQVTLDNCRTELNMRTSELHAMRTALDVCRADLNERSLELHSMRKKEANATVRAEAAKASQSAEALREALREVDDLRRQLDEESQRRAEAEASAAAATAVAEVSKDKESAEAIAAAATAAAARTAAEQSRARYSADLAIAEEERDRLEAGRILLLSRVAKMEKEKQDVETATKRLGEAEEERLAAIRRLAQVEVSHSDQLASSAAIHEGLERRVEAAEDAAAAAADELDAERHRAAEDKRMATQRLEMATSACAEELKGAREAGHAEAMAAIEAQGLERAEATEAELAVTRRELADAVKTSVQREGKVAVLRARLRSAEEEIETARREALLEARARSVAEVTDAGKRANEARAEAEALQKRCKAQERTIAALAVSREEQPGACQEAQTSLHNERSGLTKANGRLRELELELKHLRSSYSSPPAVALETSTVEAPLSGHSPNVANERIGRRPLPSRPFPAVESPTCKTSRRHTVQQTNGRYVRYDVTDAAPVSMSWDSSTSGAHFGGRGGGDGAVVGARESRERERTRAVVRAHEESVRTARAEVAVLVRRVNRLRVGLRAAERQADEMEAAAASALASAAAATARADAATAEVEVATADRHEAERKLREATHREQERAIALEFDVQKAQGSAYAAKERLVEVREEVLRLRGALGDSERRSEALAEQLAVSAADLRIAEAGRARAQMDLLCGFGRVREGRHRSRGISTSLENVTEAAAVEAVADDSGIRPRPTNPMSPALDHREGRVVELGPDDEGVAIFVLRERLTACQVRCEELVLASEDAVARCKCRCDTRVRTALAAGTLASAWCRRRGITAGREEAVEAAARLQLVRRCFGALRRDALRSSRDRAVQRHESMRRWVAEAAKVAGGEFALTFTTRRRR